MSTVSAVFVINLIQDVSVVRPVAFLAHGLGFKCEFLISGRFIRKDFSNAWQAELREIADRIDARVAVFETVFDAQKWLRRKAGILIAGSESDLPAHSPSHDVFRSTPAQFIKVTLQHGFECVGLLQSRDHDLAHGRNVTFAADVVCGWADRDRLSSMARSQYPKLYVSGPSSLLQMPGGSPSRTQTGIVCENLHSVRLNTAGDFKSDFISVFNEFCSALDQEKQDVVLRPHPGGQYVLKKELALPKNVRLNNNPIYKVDLRCYAYGISAPSSVLIDMIFAGIPVAVWRDADGHMDAHNYSGLTEVRSASDWIDFGREAIAHPERFLERQRSFLAKQRMLTSAPEVFQRFASLFASAAERARQTMEEIQSVERVLFIANANLPTLELSFVVPLRELADAGALQMEFLTEQQIREKFGKRFDSEEAAAWIDSQLSQLDPTVMVFCRYSGPHSQHLRNWGRRHKVPIIYHIDDDLLNIPLEIVGQKKFEYHNHPSRRDAVSHLLRTSDLVYCSTDRLAKRLTVTGAATSPVAGKIYCSGQIMVPAYNEPVKTVGYMGFDHAYDFEIAVPAIVALLRQYPEIHFELLGSIPKPKELEQFGERVHALAPIRGYQEFLTKFAERKWHIGICPLARIPFNLLKAVTKWVEYTSVGAAVVASRGTIYDECCGDGCGMLADTAETWFNALTWLVRNPAERFAMVAKAQKRVNYDYSPLRLREQVLDIFERAKMARNAAIKNSIRELPTTGEKELTG